MFNPVFFSFFRLTLTWIIGTLLAIYHPLPVSNPLILLLIALVGLCYFSFFFLKKKKNKQTYLSVLSSLGLLLLLLLGYGKVWLHIACSEKESFARWIENREGFTAYCVTVEKVYDTHPNVTTCRALVTHIQSDNKWYHTAGSVCFYFSQKITYRPKKGAQLLIFGMPIQKKVHHSKKICL